MGRLEGGELRRTHLQLGGALHMGAACGHSASGIPSADVVAYGAGDTSSAWGVGARGGRCYGPCMVGSRVQQRERLCRCWHRDLCRVVARGSGQLVLDFRRAM
jgi:hypothetical protein